MKALRYNIIIILLFCLSLVCSNIGSKLNQAMELTKNGDFDAAVAIYREVVSIEADNALILNNYGWTLFKADSLDQAKMILEAALQANPGRQIKSFIENNQVMVQKFLTGQKLLKSGNPKEAMLEFKEITDKNKVKDIGYKYLALGYEALEKWDEAKHNWEEIITLYENSSVRNHFYQLARKKMDDYAQAAIKIGNYEEAIRIYRIITTVEKNLAGSFNTLGYFLFLNDDLKEAKEVLEKAQKLDRAHVIQDSIETNLFMVTTFLAGEYSLRKENYQSALNEFLKVTERYPETDVGLKYLALSYEGLDEKKKADELLQRIAYLHEGNSYKNKYYHFAIAKLKLEVE